MKNNKKFVAFLLVFSLIFTFAPVTDTRADGNNDPTLSTPTMPTVTLPPLPTFAPTPEPTTDPNDRVQEVTLASGEKAVLNLKSNRLTLTVGQREYKFKNGMAVAKMAIISSKENKLNVFDTMKSRYYAVDLKNFEQKTIYRSKTTGKYAKFGFDSEDVIGTSIVDENYFIDSAGKKVPFITNDEWDILYNGKAVANPDDKVQEVTLASGEKAVLNLKDNKLTLTVDKREFKFKNGMALVKMAVINSKENKLHIFDTTKGRYYAVDLKTFEQKNVYKSKTTGKYCKYGFDATDVIGTSIVDENYFIDDSGQQVPFITNYEWDILYNGKADTSQPSATSQPTATTGPSNTVQPTTGPSATTKPGDSQVIVIDTDSTPTPASTGKVTYEVIENGNDIVLQEVDKYGNKTDLAKVTYDKDKKVAKYNGITYKKVTEVLFTEKSHQVAIHIKKSGKHTWKIAPVGKKGSYKDRTLKNYNSRKVVKKKFLRTLINTKTGVRKDARSLQPKKL